MPVSIESRITRNETRIDGHEQDIKEVKDTQVAIFSALKEIHDKLATLSVDRAKDRGFLAGVSFAFSTVGVLIGAAIDYLIHK